MTLEEIKSCIGQVGIKHFVANMTSRKRLYKLRFTSRGIYYYMTRSEYDERKAVLSKKRADSIRRRGRERALLRTEARRAKNAAKIEARKHEKQKLHEKGEKRICRIREANAALPFILHAPSSVFQLGSFV
jgi:nucleosome binding factor SPN SPT16 subunit